MRRLTDLSLILIAATSVSGCLQRDCQNTQKNVLTPIQNVQAYLGSNPDGKTLAETGCPMILKQLQGLPNGANTIRKIANQRFTNHYSRCLQWVDSERYVCDGYDPYDPNDPYPYPGYEPYPPYGPGPGPAPVPTWAPPHEGPPSWGPPHEGPPSWGPPHGRGVQANDYYPGSYGCYPESYSYCAQWEYDTTHDPGFASSMQLAANLDLTFDKTQHLCGQAISGNPAQAYSESRDLLTFITSQVGPEGQSVYAMACQQHQE